MNLRWAENTYGWQGYCPKREGGAHLPPSPHQKEVMKQSEATGPHWQGEIQIHEWPYDNTVKEGN